MGPSSTRGVATAAGALFIIAAVTAIVALFLYEPVLNDEGFVLSSSAEATRVRIGAFLELLLAFAVIGTSIVLYPVIRRQNETLALGYVCGRLLEATLILVGAISLLAVVTLNQELVPVATADAASLQNDARLLVAVHDWTFLFGPSFVLGPNTLMLAFLVYRTCLVPRAIPLLGFVGGSAIFVSAMAVLFGVYDQVSAWGGLLALPVFGWEMSLAVRLIVRGFDAPAPNQSAAQAATIA